MPYYTCPVVDSWVFGIHRNISIQPDDQGGVGGQTLLNASEGLHQPADFAGGIAGDVVLQTLTFTAQLGSLLLLSRRRLLPGQSWNEAPVQLLETGGPLPALLLLLICDRHLGAGSQVVEKAAGQTGFGHSPGLVSPAEP